MNTITRHIGKERGMGNLQEWKCPHCKHDFSTMVADHEKFDFQMHTATTMKQLWRCDNCNGYHFAYFELSSITRLWECEK